MEGRYCRLEPLDADRHAIALHGAFAADAAGLGWTYLPYGPFANAAAYRKWVEEQAMRDDPLFFAILDESGDPKGVASYMRIYPVMGIVEVGHIHFALSLRRTRAATEAMYLMMRRVFDDLGYRRYEWKCDDLNAPSRRAAARLGFVYEGTHRQSRVYKGRSRDTAWYSIIDSEWPTVRASLERWLDPSNFDGDGSQRTSLGEDG